MNIYSWLYIILFCGALLAICSIFEQIKRRAQVYHWRKTWALSEHEGNFNEIYQGIDGFLISKSARSEQDALDYIYGEIKFIPFIALLSQVDINQETIFCDFGSGIGKAVLAAAMVFPIKKSIGIEILPQLHKCACAQQEKLKLNPKYTQQADNIEFILGDFLEKDLNSINLAFINSSTLFDPTWSSLCTRLDNIPGLKTVITTSKPLKSREFTVINSYKVQMSWGVVMAYIHDRKTNIHQTT